MSKHGIEGLTKAMAIDLAPHGIRVNSIGPTFIDTPLTRPFWNDKAFHAEVVGRIKLGRLGTVEDLMGAVVFLASDAAALVTGTSLVVDGGWTAEIVAVWFRLKHVHIGWLTASRVDPANISGRSPLACRQACRAGQQMHGRVRPIGS